MPPPPLTTIATTTLQKLRLKESGLQGEVMVQRGARADTQTQVRKLQCEIGELAEAIEDPKALSDKVCGSMLMGGAKQGTAALVAGRPPRRTLCAVLRQTTGRSRRCTSGTAWTLTALWRLQRAAPQVCCTDARTHYTRARLGTASTAACLAPATCTPPHKPYTHRHRW
jgi:hypothetical protein